MKSQLIHFEGKYKVYISRSHYDVTVPWSNSRNFYILSDVKYNRNSAAYVSKRAFDHYKDVSGRLLT